MRDLVRPQTAVIAKDNTRTAERTPVTRNVGSVFRAVGAAQPLNIAETLSLRHRWARRPACGAKHRGPALTICKHGII